MKIDESGWMWVKVDESGLNILGAASISDVFIHCYLMLCWWFCWHPTQTAQKQNYFPKNCEEILPLVNCEEPQGKPPYDAFYAAANRRVRETSRGGRGPVGCIAPGARW